MIASIANMSGPLRVPLSHGLALQTYSYRTSGRAEINSLNRWTRITSLGNRSVRFFGDFVFESKDQLKSTYNK